jgi:arsenite methyltransferase
MSIQLQELRRFVSDMYSDVARFPRAQFHFPTGRPLMERLGYRSDVLARIPSGAVESFAGVGYHFGMAPLQAGESVLDIGSGAGSDAFFAALAVDSGGRVVGVDMTDRMLDKARRNVEQFEHGNVEFVRGYAEELPFDEASFDCVVSNGVINLSPDKSAVFSGIVRVLRPGGRLMFSDIVTGVELPDSVRENCQLWAECIGGAEQQQRYVRLIERAGLRVDRVEHNEAYSFSQASTLAAAEKFRVRSIRILAFKAG